MKYRLTPKFNDDKRNNAPPIEWTPEDEEKYDISLVDMIMGELHNDEGIPFGPGFSLLIERIE